MEVILGTAQLASRYGVMATQRASEPRAVAILDAARRLGVRTVDTAPGYGGAEAAIGTAGAGLAVHTKLPSGQEPAAALGASLERLRRDQVEVLHLHDPDVVLDAEDPQLAAAAALVGAGAEAIGASIYTREQFLAGVADPRIAVIQAPLNVLDRRILDEDLRLAARSGTRVIARSALLQGLLGDPAQAMGRVPLLDDGLAAFLAACRQVGRAPVDLAIGWVRARPGVVGVVLGAETPEQIEDLARAFYAPALQDDEVRLLASLSPPPEGAADPRTWSRT